MDEDFDVKEILQAQFEALPKPVQEAIMSSHVEERLQEVAKANQLHFDDWITLENEVMMVLLGLKAIDSLPQAIQEEAGVSKEEAEKIAADASRLIFDPIREELKRELQNPDAKPIEVSKDEEFRQQALAEARQAEQDSAPITAPQQEKKAPALDTDPYREPI